MTSTSHLGIWLTVLTGSYPDIDIPNVDIWGLLFERTDKDFPDDKGKYLL